MPVQILNDKDAYLTHYPLIILSSLLPHPFAPSVLSSLLHRNHFKKEEIISPLPG